MPSNKLKPKPKPSKTFEFEAIGTWWIITIDEPLAKTKSLELEQAIKKRIEQFDKNYSRFRGDSLITAMAQTAGNYQLPADAQPLFDIYRNLYQQTNGLVTPLVGQLLVDAGYDPDYSLQPKGLQKPPTWDETLVYDFPNLTLWRPAVLDLGAAGKGYLVDIISDLLLSYEITDFCVDAGGDMAQHSSSGAALEVGLEHPEHTDEVIGVAAITNQSICGSAGNRRAWEDFHHIINPTTLTSPQHIRALWVIADTTLVADALSTALFFVDPTVLAKNYDFEYAIVYDDYSLKHSPNFPAKFFTK